MSKSVLVRGSAPPNRARIATFVSDFANGLDREKWKDEGYPWHYIGIDHETQQVQPQASGQQTVINEESQYYIKEHLSLIHI